MSHLIYPSLSRWVTALVWAVFLLDPSIWPALWSHPPQTNYKRSSGHLFNLDLTSDLSFHIILQTSCKHLSGYLFNLNFSTSIFPFHFIQPKWATSTHLDKIFTLTLHFYLPYHLNQPRRHLSGICFHSIPLYPIQRLGFNHDSVTLMRQSSSVPPLKELLFLPEKLRIFYFFFSWYVVEVFFPYSIAHSRYSGIETHPYQAAQTSYTCSS